MPAGCEFVCNNKNCEYYNTGFTFTAPWPMGDIDDVINSSRVVELPELKEKLIDLKKNGRGYACITYPNVDKVKTKQYRVNLWSVEAKCIWQYDIPANDKSVSQAVKDADLPDKCPNTGAKMMNYREAINEGICCPSCGEKLKQNRWYAKVL